MKSFAIIGVSNISPARIRFKAPPFFYIYHNELLNYGYLILNLISKSFCVDIESSGSE